MHIITGRKIDYLKSHSTLALDLRPASNPSSLEALLGLLRAAVSDRGCYSLRAHKQLLCHDGRLVCSQCQTARWASKHREKQTQTQKAMHPEMDIPLKANYGIKK